MKYTNTLRIVILFLLISVSQIASAQVRLEANEGVFQVMWNPDGARLVTANPDGLVRIWDASGQLVTSFVGDSVGTLAASWSPDGTRLATGGTEGVVKIWDNAGTLLLSFAARDMVFQIDWHPDNSRIVVLGFNILDVWDTSTEQFVTLIPSGTTMDMAWSSDGTRLAHISLNDNLYIADATTYQNIVSANTPNGIPLNQVVWSPDNSRVITGDALGEIRVWDANSLTDLGSLAQVNGFIWELDYSPDGTRIAVTVDNGFVYIVDANTGVILDTIATNYPVLSVDWKSDGSEIAFVGVDSDADPTNDLQSEPAPPPFICTIVTDTPALLSAITSANTTPEADTICLEAGTYTLDAPITSEITLVGLGAGAEIRGTLQVSGAGRLTLRNVSVNP